MLFFIFSFCFNLYASNTVSSSFNQGWGYYVEQAQNKNAELASVKQKYKASEYDLNASYGNFLPKVDASMTGKLWESSDSTNKYTASLTVTENIFGGFGSLAKVRKAKAMVNIAKANLNAVKAKISYDLKYAYSSLIHAQNAVKLNSETTKRRQENLKLVELRYDNGRENKGAVLLSKAYYEQAKYDVLQAQNNLIIYRENLAKILTDKDNEFVLTEDIPVDDNLLKPDFKSIALSTPEYVKVLAQESLTEAELTASRSGFYPLLGFTGAYSKGGTDFFPNQQESWYVGLNLSFSLFNGGIDYYSTKSAAANLEAQKFNKQDLLFDINLKLQQAYSAYIEVIEKLNVDKSFVKAASIRSEIARSKYNNGLITFDDWDLIESDLINREKNLIATKKDRVIKEAAWEQIQGRGVIQ